MPTWFLIGQDGDIEISSVGWVRTDVEDLNRRLADANHTAQRRLFLPGMTCATPVLVEALKTDPAVAGKTAIEDDEYQGALHERNRNSPEFLSVHLRNFGPIRVSVLACCLYRGFSNFRADQARD